METLLGTAKAACTVTDADGDKTGKSNGEAMTMKRQLAVAAALATAVMLIAGCTPAASTTEDPSLARLGDRVHEAGRGLLRPHAGPLDVEPQEWLVVVDVRAGAASRVRADRRPELFECPGLAWGKSLHWGVTRRRPTPIRSSPCRRTTT